MFFFVGRLPPNINKAVICLIPKVASPELLSQFRPISLCNVIVKLVSKILANWLQGVIAKLVGPFQKSFISGLVVLDSIVTAQEVIHSLQRRKGRRGGMIVKVDLEKAYDRVDWRFLSQVLAASGFNSTLRGLIMNTITNAELAVCWNEEVLDSFWPTRGLRQGDPLSPYLIVLCMDTLNHLIMSMVGERC